MKRVFFLAFVLLLTACGTNTTPSQPTTPTTPDTDEPTPATGNHEPSVKLNVKTTSAKRGIEATVTATDEDGDALTFKWDFGDGATALGGEGYTYSYKKSGTYTVSVKVSDGKNEVTATKKIKVQHLRPAGSPDVVIFGFSGRCGSPVTIPLMTERCSVFENYSYLAPSIERIVQAIADRGNDVYYYDYAAIAGYGYGPEGEYGYYNALTSLGEIQRDYISDYDDPTRLILVGHSHGTVWASLLAMETSQRFDYFIYLDGVCLNWESDNLYHPIEGNLIASFANAVGKSYPRALSKYGGACNSLPVNGTKHHIKDVVPDNVNYAIEVQSDTRSVLPDIITTQATDKCNWTVRDRNPNLRNDGTTQNIYTIPTVANEDHCAVDEPSSVTMNKVISKLIELETQRFGVGYGTSGQVMYELLR